MTFEEYEKATPSVLRAQAEACFDRANNNPSWGGSPTLLLQAQFYMQELDRRDDNRVKRRDFWLEIAVIVLILGEIILSVYGIRLAIKEDKDEDAMMSRQNTILSNLQTSTQATADQLKEQIAMQNRIFINPQPFGFDGMTVYNNSKSEISIWGFKMKGLRAVKHHHAPSFVAEHTAETIRFREYYRDFSSSSVVDYELYLKNAAGEEFIWEGSMNYNHSNELGQMPDGKLRKEEWSKTVTFAQAP
jgi:hypothetical protein